MRRIAQAAHAAFYRGQYLCSASQNAACSSSSKSEQPRRKIEDQIKVVVDAVAARDVIDDVQPSSAR